MILTALLAGFAVAQPAPKPIERRFAVAPDVAIRIHNLVGLTRVTGWDVDSIAVVATIPPRAGSFFGGGGGRFAKLGIEGQDPSLTGPGSTLEVSVPRGARIWVKSAAAMTELRNVRGDVEVSSVTGAIRITGAPRVVTAETIDGDLLVEGPASVVRARSGAGRVEIIGATGDLTITTVQGRVDVTSAELSAARVETVSGAVTWRAGLGPEGRLDIETHDGPTTVRLPSGAAARFDLTTVKGKILAPAGPAGRRTQVFSIGRAPSAAVTIRTFSGLITIDSNPEAKPGI